MLIVNAHGVKESGRLPRHAAPVAIKKTGGRQGLEPDAVFRKIAARISSATAVLLCSLALLAGQGPPSDRVGLQIIVSSSAGEAGAIRGQVIARSDLAALAQNQPIHPT